MLLALVLSTAAVAVVLAGSAVYNRRRDSKPVQPKPAGQFPQEATNPDIDGTLFRRALLLVPRLVETGLVFPDTATELRSWIGRCERGIEGEKKLLRAVGVLLFRVEEAHRITNNLVLIPDEVQEITNWLDEFMNRKEA